MFFSNDFINVTSDYKGLEDKELVLYIQNLPEAIY